MSTRTVHIDRSLPALMPSDEAAWRTWLVRHGLPDPYDIPVSNAIVCDDEARTVSFERHLLTANGKMQLNDKRDEILREWVTVQLEARALPIPAGYTVTVDR